MNSILGGVQLFEYDHNYLNKYEYVIASNALSITVTELGPVHDLEDVTRKVIEKSVPKKKT